MAPLRSGEFVFPSQSGRGPLSEMACEMLLRRLGAKPATVHGFRTTFRTWVSDCTNFSRDVAEMCIDHQVGNAVERAYQRSDQLERRRELMMAWNMYLGDAGAHAVVQLKRSAA
jgi:integrase